MALGLSEAITYGFVSPKDLQSLGAPASPVVLKNPLTDERSVMRTSLLPGLLEAVQRAWRHGEIEARLFTVGLRDLRSPALLSMACRVLFPGFDSLGAGR